MTQLRQTQEGDILHGKPQADRANSWPRSQISHDKLGINNKTTKKELASKRKKTRRDMYITRHKHDNCWTSRKSSHLAEPVTLSLVTTEQAQATTTTNTIFGRNPKIKRMLFV
jgi:hypothetical protein